MYFVKIRLGGNFMENKEKKLKKFQCTVCGYIYEGEELPEDFICPICGQPASVFVEIKED